MRSFIFFNDLNLLVVLFQIVVGFICQEKIMPGIFLKQMMGASPRNVSERAFTVALQDSWSKSTDENRREEGGGSLEA